MGITYLISSIVAESTGKTIDKLNYRRNRVGPRQMMVLAFATMAVCIGLYLLATKQAAPHLSLAAVGLLVIIALLSFGGNVFDNFSMKADDLSLREPLVDFEPVLAGLIGFLAFPDQRKPIFLVAFALATVIVNWGIHQRKLRKGQKKGMSYLLIAVCMYAVLPSLYQETLHHISPAYIAFFRSAAILVLTGMFFPPKKWKGFTGRNVSYGIGASIAYSVGAVASLYAIQSYGVVLTMLFLMLGPALRYLAGQFILKEKVRRGEVLASLMLTLVVAIAAFVR
jgi:drug/metabolite transporter (DMT)-like permease